MRFEDVNQHCEKMFPSLVGETQRLCENHLTEGSNHHGKMEILVHSHET
jgi:hypothetical protein